MLHQVQCHNGLTVNSYFLRLQPSLRCNNTICFDKVTKQSDKANVINNFIQFVNTLLKITSCILGLRICFGVKIHMKLLAGGGFSAKMLYIGYKNKRQFIRTLKSTWFGRMSNLDGVEFGGVLLYFFLSYITDCRLVQEITFCILYMYINTVLKISIKQTQTSIQLIHNSQNIWDWVQTITEIIASLYVMFK